MNDKVPEELLTRVDPKTGLCEFHRTHGKEAKRDCSQAPVDMDNFFRIRKSIRCVPGKISAKKNPKPSKVIVGNPRDWDLTPEEEEKIARALQKIAQNPHKNEPRIIRILESFHAGKNTHVIALEEGVITNHIHVIASQFWASLNIPVKGVERTEQRHFRRHSLIKGYLRFLEIQKNIESTLPHELT